MLLTQRSQRRPNLPGPLLAGEAVVGGVPVIERLESGKFPVLLDGQFGPLPPPPADGGVKGDAVEPGVKGAAAVKRIQLDEGLDESVLHHVFRFDTTAHNVHEGVVQSVLMPSDQLSKRRCVAFPSLSDELEIVFHNRSDSFDAR
jgi:hypothetical protein